MLDALQGYFFYLLRTVAAVFESCYLASICPQYGIPSDSILELGNYFFDFA